MSVGSELKPSNLGNQLQIMLFLVEILKVTCKKEMFIKMGVYAYEQ